MVQVTDTSCSPETVFVLFSNGVKTAIRVTSLVVGSACLKVLYVVVRMAIVMLGNFVGPERSAAILVMLCAGKESFRYQL